jgi:hypothetical protein
MIIDQKVEIGDYIVYDSFRKDTNTLHVDDCNEKIPFIHGSIYKVRGVVRKPTISGATYIFIDGFPTEYRSSHFLTVSEWEKFKTEKQ